MQASPSGVPLLKKHFQKKGSLIDKTQRIEMANPIFSKLQRAILHPSRTKEWFGMAEQVINAVYALAEHPDKFCDEVIRNLTGRAFGRPRKGGEEEVQTKQGEGEDGEDREVEADEDKVKDKDEDHLGNKTVTEDDVTMLEPTQASQYTQGDKGKEKEVGDAFELAQLLFVVGHVAIKHIVFLELVEREWKRQKDEKQAGGSQFVWF
jgi:condensin complex subunit 1